MVHGALLCGRSMRSYRCTAVLDMTGCGYENACGHSSKQPLHDLRLGCVLTGTRHETLRGSFEVPTSKQNCLEQKDNIFTEQAPPSENACNHGFRTWLPYVCLVIPPALRL